jgi:UDP-hydrolysing UDP-N-acetyl-D-glucosamine 2-epimerase
LTLLKIAVFTGNRADYGVLYPVIQAIQAHPKLTLQLVAGGDHIRLGTLQEIQQDGLPIACELPPPLMHIVDNYLEDDSPTLMTMGTSSIVAAVHRFYAKAQPDWLVVLGDRYETFAAALAAFYHNIPILHLCGGDVTKGGCPDDTLRDLLSRLAHVHCVTTPENRARLIARGEAPWRVHVTGSPVVDTLLNTPLIPKETLMAEMGFDPQVPVVLFTQHPIPSEAEDTLVFFEQSLQALAGLPIQVLATEPNADGYGESLRTVIARWQRGNIRWEASLGRQKYLSWLAACDAVVGNSSSGLVETPFFRKPSVTVGPRQAGRQRADNVLAVSYGVEAVRKGVQTALFDPAFRERAHQCENPFAQDPCAPQVCQLLLNTPINDHTLHKPLEALV